MIVFCHNAAKVVQIEAELANSWTPFGSTCSFQQYIGNDQYRMCCAVLFTQTTALSFATQYINQETVLLYKKKYICTHVYILIYYTKLHSSVSGKQLQHDWGKLASQPRTFTVSVCL